MILNASWSMVHDCVYIIWLRTLTIVAATSENVPSNMCDRRWFRSTCACAQSDQNLLWHILDSQGCKVYSCGQQRLIRLRESAVWFESSLGTYTKVCFLTLRLIINLSLALPKHAYSNILKILPPKNENFQIKNSNIFHISAQNIDCGYW